MANTINLTNVNLRNLIDQNHGAQRIHHQDAEEKTGSKTFGDTMSEFIGSVNDSQKLAQQSAADVVQGKSDNIHEAMANLEEARMSFQLMLEVRNRLLDAYKEVERMQV